MSDLNPIRLLVFDVDGVLSEGEAQAIDLDLMAELAAQNRAARRNPALPAITLCTGRPAPYVEVLLQAIDGHLPGIFENGAGLYMPQGYQFLAHPAVADGTDIRAIRERLDATLVQSGKAYFQPGKEYSLTLFATDPSDTAQLAGWTTTALGHLNDGVDLVYSTSCLNILSREIDKGKGIQFLASQTGVQPAEMLGVGDSDVDLPFLKVVGASAAPDNANPAVKAIVHYISPYRTVQGVRDILKHFQVW